MGGDRAPDEIIAGAILAVDSGLVSAEEIVLVGDETATRAALESLETTHAFGIEHAPETIGMNEHPAQAVRRKRGSSIVIGARMIKDGRAGALVSAGNTGAMVAAATVFVRLLEGVRRPGIAVTFHGAKGPCTLIDVGANIHCQPEDLYTYGEMASQYMSGVHGVSEPKVGLLNIGEEEEKGSPLVLKTRELFNESPLNFIGNIEGQDVFTGRCDVVVCEGFVGNVVLKVSEGLGHYIGETFLAEMKRHADDDEGGVWKKVVRLVQARTDYAEYGGAPLLGVAGSVIICHGRSDRRAISNAIGASKRFMSAKVNKHIVEDLARGPDLNLESAGESE